MSCECCDAPPGPCGTNAPGPGVKLCGCGLNQCCETTNARRCIRIQWDSVSASKSKCGFATFNGSNPNKRYLVQSREMEYHASANGPYGLCSPCDQDVDLSGTRVETIDPATCASAAVCSGFWTHSCCNGRTIPGTPPTLDCSNLTGNRTSILCSTPHLGLPNGGPLYASTVSTSSLLSDCGWYVGFQSAINALTPTLSALTREWSGGGTDTGEITGAPPVVEGTYNQTWSLSRTDTLSEEFTDEMLIEQALAALPAFDEDWNDTAGTFRLLSGTTFSVRAANFRLAHPPTGPCYLKVGLRSKFVPQAGGTPVYADLDPHEWIGAGNPCFPEAEKAHGHNDNLIYSDSIELEIPEEDGTTTVEVTGWTYVPGGDLSLFGFAAP